MARIHPSAVIEGDVQLADDCQIGPWCVLRGRVRVGSRCTLIAGVHLQGPLQLGEGNTLYPGVCLGFAPQDLGFDPNKDGAGLVIGNGNTFREGVTIHRAKTDSPTRVGDNNYWMAGAHMGHDGVLGSNCVMANATQLAGHVQIGDRVTFGGGACVHQFVRVGTGAFFSGLAGASLDVPPWFTVTSTNCASSFNRIGLRRSGATPQQIDTVRWVYRTLVRSRHLLKHSLEELRARQSVPLVADYIRFIESAKRGVCLARGRSVESAAR